MISIATLSSRLAREATALPGAVPARAAELQRRLDTPVARALLAQLPGTDEDALVAKALRTPAEMAVAERVHEEARSALGAYLRHGEDPVQALKRERSDKNLQKACCALAERVEQAAYAARAPVVPHPTRAQPRAAAGGRSIR